MSYQCKKLVNRGFLFGPFCPIYGFGVLLLIVSLSPISSSPLLFFIGAIAITSSLEYLTGFILEKIFKTNWWDYSNEKYNLDGKICLKFSIYWGFLSLVLFYFIHPTINSLTTKILNFSSFYLPFILVIYFTVDLVLSIISVAHLQQHIKNQKHRLFKAFPHVKLSKYFK